MATVVVKPAKRYKLIEHTADIGLVAYGACLPEAFANAAYGMFSIMADLRSVRQVEARTVELAEDNIEALLFGWLNHLVYLFDVQSLLFKRFDVLQMTERRLQAVCRGEKYDPARHRLKIGIKSATYHLLKVDREQNQVQVIFDI